MIGGKEWAKEEFKQWLLGALEATGEVVRDFIVDASFSIALIGGGLCLIAYVAGWRDGKRWTGILFVANALIQYLLR